MSGGSDSDYEESLKKRKRAAEQSRSRRKKKPKSKFGEREKGQAGLGQFNLPVPPMAEEPASEGNRNRSASVSEIPETPPSLCKSQLMGEDRPTEKRPSSFQTARVRFETKVPSHTTPNTHYATGEFVQCSSLQRSPLANRSHNLQSPATIRPKILETQLKVSTVTSQISPDLVRGRVERIKDHTIHQRANGGHDELLVLDPCTTGALELDRAHAIQESQRNRCSLDESPGKLNPPPRRRNYIHTGVVEDSQDDSCTDLDLASIPEARLTPRPPALYTVDSDHGVDSYLDDPPYSDPALAALDRDASRFVSTQIGAQTQRSPRAMVDDSETEEDEDLAAGCTNVAMNRPRRSFSAEKIPQLPTNKPRDAVSVLSPGTVSAMRVPTRPVETTREPGRTTSNQEPTEDSNDAPHSSPPLRPSQISTVVGTSSPRALSPGTVSAVRVPTRPVETTREPGRTTSNQEPEAEDSNDAPRSSPPLRPSQVSTVVGTPSPHHTLPRPEAEDSNGAPHSSPPLRPSQVSTVVGTPSPHHTPPRNAPVIDLTNSTPPPAPTSAETEPGRVPFSLSRSSPSISLANGTARSLRDFVMSTSPIPLPVSDSTEWMGRVRRSRSATSLKSQPQLEDLVDFSLPPPPPPLTSFVSTSSIPLPVSDSTEWMERVRRSRSATSLKSQPQLEDLFDLSLPPPPPPLSSFGSASPIPLPTPEPTEL